MTRECGSTYASQRGGPAPRLEVSLSDGRKPECLIGTLDLPKGGEIFFFVMACNNQCVLVYQLHQGDIQRREHRHHLSQNDLPIVDLKIDVTTNDVIEQFARGL